MITRTPNWIEAAAQSLKKERQTNFGGTVDVVGAASSISGDGGDSGQASSTPVFQIGSEQREDRGGTDKVDLQLLQQNVNRGFGILLVVHGAVSDEHGVKIGKHALGKFEDGGVLGMEAKSEEHVKTWCAPRRSKSDRSSARRWGERATRSNSQLRRASCRWTSSAMPEVAPRMMIFFIAALILAVAGVWTWVHRCGLCGVHHCASVTRLQNEEDILRSKYGTKLRQRGNEASNKAGLIRASLAGYSAPPLSRTISSSDCMSLSVRAPRMAKSSAMVSTDRGKESMPAGGAEPNCFRTSKGRAHPGACNAIE